MVRYVLLPPISSLSQMQHMQQQRQQGHSACPMRRRLVLPMQVVQPLLQLVPALVLAALLLLAPVASSASTTAPLPLLTALCVMALMRSTVLWTVMEGCT